MTNPPASIRPVDPTTIDLASYASICADCIILTRDHKILLQQRTPTWHGAPGCLTPFGGHVEAGETPLQGMIRELHEELGAVVNAADVIALGALTEADTNHTTIVYGYFWHDRHGTITGCYECEAVYYDRVTDALAHPKIMDYAVWYLRQCQERGLLTEGIP